MDAQLEARPPSGVLVESFAEFPLIPDLLCRYDPEGGDWEREWAYFMDMWQCDMDHIEDRHLPVGMAVILGMVEDAFQFCQRIGLIGPRGGVSAAGRRLIELTDEAEIGDRHHEVSWRRLSRFISTRIFLVQAVCGSRSLCRRPPPCCRRTRTIGQEGSRV